MRISKLYIKIFIAFLLVLLAAEGVVIGLLFTDRIPEPHVHGLLERTRLTALLIERELREGSPAPPPADNRLRPLMDTLGRVLKGKIWLTFDGTIVAANFTDPVPDTGQARTPVEHEDYKDIRIFATGKPLRQGVYLQAPIHTPQGPPMVLHVYREKRPSREEAWFFKGLLLLTFLAAAFTIPVSRRITRPILKLTEASERLGQGDFSQRVTVRGGDEVADLARKFNRMAERLEKMVSSGKELTAHVSHELRSPLARLRVSLQIIQERAEAGDPADNTTLLAKMIREIENMDLLIGQILELSKLDLREPPARTDRIDMAKMLRTMLDTYAPMIEKQAITLHADIAPLPPLPCHAGSMGTLLDNLLGNALKYTERDKKIAVHLSEADGMLTLRICNTHPPLSENDLSAMFEPFQRVGNEEKTGSGFGLAVARKIVEIHDGTIDATQEGDHICMTVRLPLRS